MKQSMNAVVTGGGSGLGRALCLAVVRRQGRVVVADLEEGRAKELVARIDEEFGEGRAYAFHCDVAQASQVEALADFAGEVLGTLDLVVNNAGVAAGGLIGDTSLEDWRWVNETNLWGVIHGCHIFLPRLKAQGHGAILNVASAAGLLCPPQLAPYNVAKAGVVALSETLYVEALSHGVGVTVLCPTFFRTKLLENARGGDEKSLQLIEKLMDKGRVQADGVAQAALDAVARGELYCVPSREGRWLWTAKRLLPQHFLRTVHRVAPWWRKRRSGVS